MVIGFCFCRVHSSAESWLNNAATNENLSQSFSFYLMLQIVGIVVGQGLLVTSDPGGSTLFNIISGFVSVSFAPILLSISPAQAFETTNPMPLKKLIETSPLACAGMFVLGGLFSAQFGMAAVYGAEVSLSLGEISLFVATCYIGAVFLQYPIGWLSDRMDRRRLIMSVAAIGAVGALIGVFMGQNFTLLLVSASILGGASNPPYSLLIAHTNDFLNFDDMVSASGGLLFINGIGAIAAPLILGWVMQAIGASGFFVLICLLMAVLALYAAYRTTQRAAPTVGEANTYQIVTPTASLLSVEFAQEIAIEAALEEESQDVDQ